MEVHSGNEALMCMVLPFNLEPMAMHWFDALQKGSIQSFGELTRVFGTRFVMCSRVSKTLDSLLSMAIREKETLKTYSDKYWKMYNEIDGDFEDVAMRTFKFGQPETGYQRDGAPRPALGTINVVSAKPKDDAGTCSGVMSVVSVSDLKDRSLAHKNAKMVFMPTLGFSKEDKKGTLQPIDDALVVTVRIRGYDVKRVLVDQGSGAKTMYPDLYKRLKLKSEDLEKYNSPLVGFNGRLVIPCEMIRLPVQVGDEEVQVNFIMVEAYSPYMAILSKPWLHSMGAVSSILHLKVKYPTQGRVGEFVGSQATARQCLVAAITWPPVDHAVVEEE
ncbi:uncharacterized protein LOC142612232 [Castanea sativa]|uniref:uncharacterized protein LOC142612232 n=1 Tax=Castanea sativa TaxID=21020 RepID=UPI003F654255